MTRSSLRCDSLHHFTPKFSPPPPPPFIRLAPLQGGYSYISHVGYFNADHYSKLSFSGCDERLARETNYSCAKVTRTSSVASKSPSRSSMGRHWSPINAQHSIKVDSYSSPETNQKWSVVRRKCKKDGASLPPCWKLRFLLTSVQ